MKNVVILMLDDCSKELMALNMPKMLQRLRGGTEFREACTIQPLCTPTRSMLLSGQAPWHTEVRSNDAWRKVNPKDGIALQLQKAGMTTAIYGKYLNNHDGTPQEGYDEWGCFDGSTIHHGAYYDYVLNHNGTRQHYGSKARDYSTCVIQQLALSFVKSATKPFYLYLPLGAAHRRGIVAEKNRGTPVTIPTISQEEREPNRNDKPPWVRNIPVWSADRKDLEERETKLQAKTLLAADDLFAAVYDSVQALGQGENTLWFVTSDSGYMFGQKQLSGKAYPYEPSINIPLLFKDGSRETPPTIDELVTTVDIMPTILRENGITPTTHLDGLPLQILVNDEDEEWREELPIECCAEPAKNMPAWFGTRGKDWKRVRYASGHKEFFNLGDDPLELTSIPDPDEE